LVAKTGHFQGVKWQCGSHDNKEKENTTEPYKRHRETPDSWRAPCFLRKMVWRMAFFSDPLLPGTEAGEIVMATKQI
jgi:hypothetical protein